MSEARIPQLEDRIRELRIALVAAHDYICCTEAHNFFLDRYEQGARVALKGR